ncbi:MAG TPA: HAMP domain-containing sensor histidine kinase [Kofleriaceae bacterium]|nr:HAMP domain-containing sensor histidine kinase [Kofleriaceae bacterium]
MVRSKAVTEESDEVIERARQRARLVLDLAREREDHGLVRSGVAGGSRETVAQERRTEDAALAAERGVADAQRMDERERRRAAMIQLLTLERAATDRTLAAERTHADRSITAREDLLALVAHDLRNMLSTIMVNASVIVLATDLKTMRGPAVQVQRAGGQMAQLLEDLLDFSSFEAGKLSLASVDVDVVQVVRDAVEIHAEAAKVQKLELTLHADVPKMIVRGDGRRLTRLLMNLIGNALKFTPEDGRVDVHVAVVGDECEIAVTDNGVGIPKEELDSIFERFQRGGIEERQRFSGVGLGLFIARLIADAHGGRVWAESGEAGTGSTFRVRLPIAAP